MFDHIAHQWTELWNGNTSLAFEICTPGFTIWLGRADSPANTVRGPEEFAAFVDDFRSTRAGLTYSTVAAYPGTDTLTLLWNADMGELHVGGIDVLHLDPHGKIARAHSVTGEHPVRLDPTDEAR